MHSVTAMSTGVQSSDVREQRPEQMKFEIIPRLE